MKKRWMLLGLSVGWACVPGFAFAYLDPATSSFLIQIIAGVLITYGVAMGVFRKKIGMFFRKLYIKAMGKRDARKSKSK